MTSLVKWLDYILSSLVLITIVMPVIYAICVKRQEEPEPREE